MIKIPTRVTLYMVGPQEGMRDRAGVGVRSGLAARQKHGRLPILKLREERTYYECTDFLPEELNAGIPRNSMRGSLGTLCTVP